MYPYLFLLKCSNFRDYLDKLAEEINDNLQSSGQVTFAELSKTYDLPGDFLLPVSVYIFTFLRKTIFKCGAFVLF